MRAEGWCNIIFTAKFKQNETALLSAFILTPCVVLILSVFLVFQSAALMF